MGTPKGKSNVLVGGHQSKRSKKKARTKRINMAVMRATNSMKIRINFKIVVVGDGAVGKTCMLDRHFNNQFVEGYELTVFESTNSIIHCQGKDVTIALWDTAGQEEFTSIRIMTYTNADVFLMCYSVVNPDSLHNIKSWVKEIRQHSEAPIVLVGTKIDLLEDKSYLKKMENDDIKPVTLDMAESLRREIDAEAVVQCSSKLNKGIDDVFLQAVRSATKFQQLKKEWLQRRREKLKNQHKVENDLGACSIM
jgi:small GTP-binding protein